MSQLQLGLIVAGVLLVVGVLLYNWLQERRLRRRLEPPVTRPQAADTRSRVEPTFGPVAEEVDTARMSKTPVPSTPAVEGTEVEHDPDWRPPIEPIPPLPEEPDRVPTIAPALAAAAAAADVRPRSAVAESSGAAVPDRDIECVVTLQPTQPVNAGMVAAGLHARLGKTVRWYGRRAGDGPWQRLASDTRGEYSDFAACMLLADRNGAATRSQIDAFLRLVAEIAPTLPAAFVAPPLESETERAEALDRLCAELDIQIGLTIQKPGGGGIPGTRLRGVAEAAGFRLAPNGRFEWVQEETGVVLFTMQNITEEAFTAESLRLGTVSGVVFLLDVPRVADPPRAFDQMKLAAKRMAQTLDGEVVDDNRRPLNEAGLGAIRTQVADATAALRRYHIEPGSPRALKLFSA
jgi:hypothetical protein